MSALGRARRKLGADGPIELLRDAARQAVAPRYFSMKFLVPLLVPIQSRADLKARYAGLEYASGEELDVGSPMNDPGWYELERVRGTYSFDPPFVCAIDDVTIVPPRGWGIHSRGLILESALARRDKVEAQLAENPGLLRSIRRARSHRATEGIRGLAVSLLDTTSYSKFVTKGLPRLEGIRAYERKHGVSPSFVVPADPPAYMTQGLALFGYGSDRHRTWDGRPVHVDRLLVSTARCVEHRQSAYDQRLSYDLTFKAVPPSASRWVRNTGMEAVSAGEIADTRPSRIYISRSDSDERRVVNRGRLVSELTDRGFEAFELSALPLEEQIALFSGAECVVAPHGAGLANLMFSHDCHVVELFGSKVKPTYYQLAQSVDAKYWPLQCTPIDRDLEVEVDEVVDVVDAALSASSNE